jgi:malonyl CoA-acyl carrier protein transacylase
MKPTVNVQLTLEQLETIADALQFTGEVVEEDIKESEVGTEEHEGLTADLQDLTNAMEVIADAMEELVGEEEE